eukprot:TRINITY_DN52502_c0_g1_i1.p1 TRINITY_DN52502_c0_g1~~TRINITY_DN52502_c0_g1_i1.p1  ORF type:complete len:263 (-),score=19.59 TRINITY_DN52502_c0_g1_i1:114-902(-)
MWERLHCVFILSRISSLVAETGHGAFPGSVVRVSGDPILAAKAALVTGSELRCPEITPSAGDLMIPKGCGAIAESWVARMLQGLQETRGAAIAAPQVGVSKRIIVFSIPSERLREEKLQDGASEVSPPMVMVNPELWPLNTAKHSAQSLQEVWETCLSVPGKRVVARRHPAVRYRAQRLDGVVVEGEAKGRLALTLQHEIDHLEGILMTDVGVEAMLEGQPRADGLGPVTSTAHWDLMHAPWYSLRNYTFAGAGPLTHKAEL